MFGCKIKEAANVQQESKYDIFQKIDPVINL